MESINFKLLGKYRKFKNIKDPDNLFNKGYFYYSDEKNNELSDYGIIVTNDSLYRYICFQCGSIGEYIENYYNESVQTCDKCQNYKFNLIDNYNNKIDIYDNFIRVESDIINNKEVFNIYSLKYYTNNKETDIILKEKLYIEGEVDLETYNITIKAPNHFKPEKLYKVLYGENIFKLKSFKKLKDKYLKIKNFYTKENTLSNISWGNIKKIIIENLFTINNKIDLDSWLQEKYIYLFTTLLLGITNNNYNNYKLLNFSTPESILDYYNINSEFKEDIFNILDTLTIKNGYVAWNQFNFLNNWLDYDKDLINFFISYIKEINFNNNLLFSDICKFNESYKNLNSEEQSFILNFLYQGSPIYKNNIITELQSRFEFFKDNKIAITNNNFQQYYLLSIANSYKERYKILLENIKEDPIKALEFFQKEDIDVITKKELEEIYYNDFLKKP